VPLPFLEDLVRAVLVFILDIEDGIDEMFALQRPEAILPAETGKHRAVAGGSLAIQVDFRGPPGGRAVFEFRPVAVEVVPAPLGPEGREILDLQVAGFLQIVIIGDKIRTLLGDGIGSRAKREQKKTEGTSQSEPIGRNQETLLAIDLQ